VGYRDQWKLDVPGHSTLRTLHEALRDELWSRYRRSLPLGDELVDRWERAEFLGFGKDVSIYDSSVILGDVKVGDGTWIGPQTVLDGSGGLSVGHHCSISAGVHLYSHDTVTWALTGGKAAYRRMPTRVGDCCYLGPLAIVTAGVTIGDHCVIGAHALVSGDVPSHAIVFGNPGRVVGKVELCGEEDVRFVYE